MTPCIAHVYSKMLVRRFHYLQIIYLNTFQGKMLIWRHVCALSSFRISNGSFWFWAVLTYQPIAFTTLSGSLRPVSVKPSANHNLPRKDRPRVEFPKSFLAGKKRWWQPTCWWGCVSRCLRRVDDGGKTHMPAWSGLDSLEPFIWSGFTWGGFTVPWKWYLFVQR